MFEYILFSSLIFGWIILNATSEKLDNTRPRKEYELLKNGDTMFVNDTIDTILYSLVLKEDGIYFYQKFPNELLFTLTVPNVYFLVFFGNNIIFFDEQSKEIKKISPDPFNVITLDETYFFTISDGNIKISDSNGQLVNNISKLN